MGEACKLSKLFKGQGKDSGAPVVQETQRREVILKHSMPKTEGMYRLKKDAHAQCGVMRE